MALAPSRDAGVGLRQGAPVEKQKRSRDCRFSIEGAVCTRNPATLANRPLAASGSRSREANGRAIPGCVRDLRDLVDLLDKCLQR